MISGTVHSILSRRLPLRLGPATSELPPVRERRRQAVSEVSLRQDWKGSCGLSVSVGATGGASRSHLSGRVPFISPNVILLHELGYPYAIGANLVRPRSHSCQVKEALQSTAYPRLSLRDPLLKKDQTWGTLFMAPVWLLLWNSQ